MIKNLKRGALQTVFLVIFFVLSPTCGRGSTDMKPGKYLYLKEVLQEKEMVTNQTKAPDKNRESQTEDEILKIPMPRFKMVEDKILRVQLKRPRMTHPQKVLAIMRSLHLDLNDGREYAHVITLDHDLSFLNAWDVTGKSGSHYVNVDRKEMLRRVMASDYAAVFIMCHNHPSGDPNPSDDDFDMIERLKKDAELIETPMRDFIILADGSEKYFSLRDNSYEI